MKCVLLNSVKFNSGSGGPIENLSFSHHWTDWDGIDSPPNNGNITLQPGETLTFDINVGPGGRDLWSFSFTVPNPGNIQGAPGPDPLPFSSDSKQCDISHDDHKTGKPIAIVFQGYLDLWSGDGNGWSVDLPATSSCLNNAYDQD